MGKNQIRANAEKTPQPRLAGHVNQSKFKVEKRIELKLLEY